MVCPYCSLYISDPSAQTCPRCGQSLLNRPDRAPGSEPFTTGPTSPYGQPYQPGYPPPATSQWMEPALAPAPAQPARRSSRRRRTLISGIVFIVIMAACIGWGFLTFFTHGKPASSSTLPSNVLFSDPLTSTTDGWANDGSHCFFQDGSYHVKDGYLCFAPAGNISDAQITVQAKQIAGSPLIGYGIALRRVSKGNFYEFEIVSNSQWRFAKYVNDALTDIVKFSPSPAIKGGLNTINTLSVIARGSQFEFLINGTQVGEATDSTFSTGLTGLRVGNTGVEVAFNNFEVTAAS